MLQGLVLISRFFIGPSCNYRLEVSVDLVLESVPTRAPVPLNYVLVALKGDETPPIIHYLGLGRVRHIRKELALVDRGDLDLLLQRD